MAYSGDISLGLAAGLAAAGAGHGLDRGGSARTGRFEAAARWLAVLVAALVAAALARVIPGRPGYWLDLGLLMFAAYLCGCAVGSWLRDWVLSRNAPRPV